MAIQGLPTSSIAAKHITPSCAGAQDGAVQDYRSTIVSEKRSTLNQFLERISTIPQKIWSGIKWVFETIFCCFRFGAEVPSKTKKEQLVDERDKFSKVREVFIEKKSIQPFNREAFKTWWVGVYDSLPQTMQQKLVKEAMRDHARAKNLLKPDAQNEWIETAYMNPALVEKNTLFVRDLAMQSTEAGSWDPISDDQLPAILSVIIGRINASIEKNGV